MDDIQFVETDTQAITASNIAALQAAAGRAFEPGDPVRLVTLAFSYIQSVVAASANHAANQSFRDIADSASLDALGALLGVTRRAPEAARTTLRFSVGAAREEVVLVPRGTRATAANSSLYFATIQDAEIPIGETTIDVIAESVTLGPSANGLMIGEMNTLVDSVQWVIGVTNLSASSDGSEAEDDASLRERMREAVTRFSTGGPEDAYITLAKDSRADVESVSINSPSPRVIDIYFTLTDGAIPATETIAEVLAYLSDQYRRPMSDVVQVHAPTPVEYTIHVTYYIATADEARATAIQAAVAQAVTDYIAWQRAAIGRDVNPSELITRICNAGALRVTVTGPVYADLDYSELAVIDGDPTVEFGGIVDE